MGVENIEEMERVLQNYGKVVLATIEERNKTWGDAWNEMKDEGLEAQVHAKAHRLCNCSQDEKRECLVDMLAYAVKRWQRGFD